MPYRSYYLDETGKLTTDLSLVKVRRILKAGKGLLWVDISETAPDDAALLSDVFHFHKLSVEDCLEEQIHPPKIDDFDDHIFAIFHGINHSSSSDVVETAELALFLGPNYVVTNHNTFLLSVDAVVHQVQSNGRPMHHGPDFLVYSLVDALVDNVLPTLDVLTDVTSRVEEDSLGRPDKATLQTILRIKRSVRRIHRTMVPQRELLNRLSRGEYSGVAEKSLIYFRDVYDHLVRIEDLTMTIRDAADNALSTYLSTVANRQNETMKVLAVVGAIFLPLTLLAGVYGMNFDYMPELHWRYGYHTVLGVMLAVIVGSLIGFWHRGWFTFGKPRDRIAQTFAVERGKLRGHLPVPQSKHPPEDTADDARDGSAGLDGHTKDT